MVDCTTTQSAGRGAMRVRAAKRRFGLWDDSQCAISLSNVGGVLPSVPSFDAGVRLPKLLLGFLLLVPSILCGLSGFASAQDKPPTGLDMAVAIEDSLIRTIAKCEKSVVAIWRVNPTSQGTSPSIPAPGVEFLPLRYGTGVVIDRKGLILTQYQLLDEKDVHWVTTSDRITYEAKIRAADPRSGLAVLEIDVDNLTPIEFGDADSVKKGQIVIALGNPHAIARDGQVSASWGIVSNIGRKAGISYADVSQPIDKPIWSRPTLHHYGTLIQTDARLNLGSSGSTLVNLKGKMIGLTTSIASTPGHDPSAEYAVPMNQDMRRIIDRLKEGREVEYGVLGVRISPLKFDPKKPTTQGVYISDVIQGGPASVAGLQKQDLVSHIKDEPMTDPDRMMLRLGFYQVETKIQIRYIRRDKKKSTNVVLLKLGIPGRKIYTKREAPWRGMNVDYSTATTDLYALSRKGLLDPQGCVLIKKVDKESATWKEGLRPNMFISHVDGRRVKRPADFRNAIASKKGPVRIRLTTMSAKTSERVIQPGA